jgi:hypothetical protein
MWNGFYSLSTIKDIGELREFFHEALMYSTSHHVDWLPPGNFGRRETHPTMSATEYIDNHITLNTHNVAIDRWVYNSHSDWARKEGEIGSSTLFGESIYLFIYLDLDKFHELIDKWNLPKL